MTNSPTPPSSFSGPSSSGPILISSFQAGPKAKSITDYFLPSASPSSGISIPKTLVVDITEAQSIQIIKYISEEMINKFISVRSDTTANVPRDRNSLASRMIRELEGKFMMIDFCSGLRSITFVSTNYVPVLMFAIYKKCGPSTNLLLNKKASVKKALKESMIPEVYIDMIFKALKAYQNSKDNARLTTSNIIVHKRRSSESGILFFALVKCMLTSMFKI